jgi:integrase
MKNRFRLVDRKNRGFYCLDSETGKRVSLQTKNRTDAEQIVFAKNQAAHQPNLNRQLAKAYLSGTDPGMSSRTWQAAFDAIVERKHGSTRERWERGIKNSALDLIRHTVIVETQPDQLWQTLKAGTVSTNIHLREIHNLCLAMGWLPWPIIPQRQWPKIRYGIKRAITAEEHQRIVAREKNPEYKAFYELCWHLGGSQSDVASLHAENIDWPNRVIGYARRKTQSMAFIHFGDELEVILRGLPSSGRLFPRLAQMKEKHRAKEFKRRCNGLGIAGVSLHSYRYAWAERARKCGYPERFAQEALGHNSKAVHRAYARHAQVTLPSLEKYERNAAAGNIIPQENQQGKVIIMNSIGFSNCNFGIQIVANGLDGQTAFTVSDNISTGTGGRLSFYS